MSMHTEDGLSLDSESQSDQSFRSCDDDIGNDDGDNDSQLSDISNQLDDELYRKESEHNATSNLDDGDAPVQGKPQQQEEEEEKEDIGEINDGDDDDDDVVNSDASMAEVVDDEDEDDEADKTDNEEMMDNHIASPSGELIGSMNSEEYMTTRKEILAIQLEEEKRQKSIRRLDLQREISSGETETGSCSTSEAERRITIQRGLVVEEHEVDVVEPITGGEVEIEPDEEGHVSQKEIKKDVAPISKSKLDMKATTKASSPVKPPPIIRKNLDNDDGNQNEENGQTLFYPRLKAGFEFLKLKQEHLADEQMQKTQQSQSKKKSKGPTKSTIPPISQIPSFKDYTSPRAIVNFIDYTSTKKEPTPASNPSQLQQQQQNSKRKLWNRQKNAASILSLNLYSKLNTIFQNQYQSTLTSVPHNNLRTNAKEVIPQIPIKTQLIGAAPQQSSDDNNNADKADGGGNASSSTSVGTTATERTKYDDSSPSRALPILISDPAEWHQGPMCHVYIAACSSLDHYRTRVRPAIQAFVSQIEGAGSGNFAAAASAAVKATNNEFKKKMGVGGDGSGAVSANGGGGGVADSLNKKKMQQEQVVAASKAVEAANDAAGGNYSCQYVIVFVPVHPSMLVEEEGNTASLAAAARGGFGLRGRVAAATSRGNGTTTTDSMASDTSMHDNGGSVHGSHSVQNSTMTKEHRELFRKFTIDFPNGRTCLFSTILEAENAKRSSPLKNQEWHEFLTALGRATIAGFHDRVQRYDDELRRLDRARAANDKAFNWNRYFLIKESLALTYEQVQIPIQAMREYEELEVALPTGLWDLSKDEKSPALVKRISEATSGNINLFRRMIRSKSCNIKDAFYLVQQYIAMRQIHLLFCIKRPVAVIHRFGALVRNIQQLRCETQKTITSGEEEELKFSQETEAMVFNASWDLKVTSEPLFSVAIEIDEETDQISSFGLELRDALFSLSDIVNLARMCLLRIGDVEFSRNNLIRRAMAKRPSDTLVPWKPLEEARESQTNLISIKSSGDKAETPTLKSGMSYSNLSMLLKGTLTSESAFGRRFIQLTETLIQQNVRCGRLRSAIYLQAELAEVHFLRGEYEEATSNLLPVIDRNTVKSWGRVYAWRLFRLACCQRICCTPKEYLRTLTCCFDSSSSVSMPRKLLSLLQQDLEDVVRSSEIAEDERLTLSEVFYFNLNLKETNGGFHLEQIGTISHKIVNNVCFVGDSCEIEITIFSNLPNLIKVNSIQVLLYQVNNFQGINETDSFITLEDTGDGNSVIINPGMNTYKMEWNPMGVGQYVLSTICVQWEKAKFYHDLSSSRNYLLGLDVKPSDPTQTIEMNPIFLIPGHVQTVRLVFQSGSDIVTGGNVEFLCSNGLKIKPPNSISDDWHSACALDLGRCEPHSQVTLELTVKSEAIESYESGLLHTDDYFSTEPQTLRAKVMTSFHHGSYAKFIDNLKEPEPPAPMTAVIEAMVTTLECPALTIHSVEDYRYSEDMVIIRVRVRCNTPVSFSLKDWDVHFDSPLCLAEDGDLNDGLFGHPVSDGEELFFGFKCLIKSEVPANALEQQSVLHVTLKDDFDKTFRQVLPLDLGDFYLSLKEIDETSKMDTATAELTCCDGLHGTVGSAVSFTYLIDSETLSSLDKLNTKQNLLYHISCVKGNWILGGKTRGFAEITKASFELNFVAIPTKSGLMKEFPDVQLAYASLADATEKAPRIKVHLRHPEKFTVSPYRNHVALACVSGLEQMP